MNDDLTLLREYVATNSEAAFDALVSRYVNLVYSVALRQVGDAHYAKILPRPCSSFWRARQIS